MYKYDEFCKIMSAIAYDIIDHKGIINGMKEYDELIHDIWDNADDPEATISCSLCVRVGERMIFKDMECDFDFFRHDLLKLYNKQCVNRWNLRGGWLLNEETDEKR